MDQKLCETSAGNNDSFVKAGKFGQNTKQQVSHEIGCVFGGYHLQVHERSPEEYAQYFEDL